MCPGGGKEPPRMNAYVSKSSCAKLRTCETRVADPGSTMSVQPLGGRISFVREVFLEETTPLRRAIEDESPTMLK